MGLLADRVVMLQDGKVKLQEATEALLERHRQVEVYLSDDAVHAPGLPRTWSAVQQTGRILRFIDSAFSAAQLASDIQHHLPGAQSHSVEMLPLREVFSHVVKHVQTPASA